MLKTKSMNMPTKQEITLTNKKEPIRNLQKKDFAEKAWESTKDTASDAWEKTKDASEDVKAEVRKATN